MLSKSATLGQQNVAEGFFHSMGGNVSATLRNNQENIHLTYTFLAERTPPEFKCTSAVLNYTKTFQLSEESTFEGRVGPDVFEIKFEGAELSGRLDKPIQDCFALEGSWVPKYVTTLLPRRRDS